MYILYSKSTGLSTLIKSFETHSINFNPDKSDEIFLLMIAGAGIEGSNTIHGCRVMIKVDGTIDKSRKITRICS
jgi:hypothetical protein